MKQYKFQDSIIGLVLGDITEQNSDAIVNAANNHLWMGGGVAGAIKRKGGKVIEQEAVAQGPIKVGEAVITGAGKLRTKYVIHAAVMGEDFKTDENKIRLATRNSLKLAEKFKLDSIAFPALGTGVGGFSKEKCAEIMVDEVISHIKQKGNIKKVVFVLFDQITYSAFERILDMAIS
ncbi:MAG: macro domain-containing protein [candidate division WOR-3 bacterium]